MESERMCEWNVTYAQNLLEGALSVVDHIYRCVPLNMNIEHEHYEIMVSHASHFVLVNHEMRDRWKWTNDMFFDDLLLIHAPSRCVYLSHHAMNNFRIPPANIVTYMSVYERLNTIES